MSFATPPTPSKTAPAMLHDRTIDLSNCDREPIHIPGSIQTHGCMLACDDRGGTVVRHSLNAAAMLGLGGAINGAALSDLIGDKAAHDLRNALATASVPERPALLFNLALANGAHFDVAAHRFRSTVIFEFEPAGPEARQPLALMREMIGRLTRASDIPAMLRDGARLVRGLLGYDRVMVYRFGHDGAGQVVSEAKRGDLESFLGQYFPASDIPRQARALYLRNTIRIISNAAGAAVRIEPQEDSAGEPLDLSYAHLRSVSPIHLEYLRNMGVSASMSISIIIDGALWGLIACHHYTPHVLPMAERVAAEMFGEFFSLHLNALQQQRKLENARQARMSLDRFVQFASHYGEVDELLRERIADIAALVPCDGAGLWMNGIWSGIGVTPPSAAVPALARFAGEVTEGRIWGTHALSQRLSQAEDYYKDVSGVLIVPLSQMARDYLFFFRREVVQTLDWAGNPSKTYETGPLGDRLTPRKSFAIWKEEVHMRAEPWTDADREIAEAIRGALVEIVLRHNEMIADERRKADVRQRMLNEELNHRVKNILSVIKSLVGHPVSEQRALSDYVTSLKGRIQALSFAHDQVVRSDGGGLLADLLNAELTPYRNQSAAITFSGPPVWLDSRAFSVMALVLHELSTNAAKYGALSISGGRLDVAWALTEEKDCRLEWRESGGPPVEPPKRHGFGTVLIDRSVPYDLGGESDVAYARDGLRAHFLLPRRHVSEIAESDALPAADRPAMAVTAGDAESLADIQLLLVEDQMLIALDVESMLADHGISRVTTTGSAMDALHRLDVLMPDIAVLDLNLGATTSLPVAAELARRGIPFLFATGYGATSILPTSMENVPVVRKPYDAEVLMAAIRRTLKRVGKL